MEEKIVINAEEVETVLNRLEIIMNLLTDASLSSFSVIKNNPFFFEGVAKEPLKKIYDCDKHGESGGYEMFEASSDLFGKTQMLINYYNLVYKYCMDALICFMDLDEDLAKLIRNRVNGGENNDR